jgi:N-succinyl-L-ornithine transcarbamylase
MKQFISITDVVDPKVLVEQAIILKADPFAHQELGRNKTIGLLFFNASLRTRLSTQKAAQNLGMEVMVLNVSEDSWQIEFEDGAVMNGGTAEHIKEAAGVISQYCDIIGVRTFAGLKNKQEDYSERVINSFAAYATVPIISLESATLHPLQSLADAITIEEQRFVKRPKVVLTWAPHPRALPQAVANSFAQWMNVLDVDLVIANPAGYDLDPEFCGDAQVTHNQQEAFAGADFIYAKNWSALDPYGSILNSDDSWMVDEAKMALTNDAKFMHCLPVRRNVVVADGVIDSPNSLVLEQANNRVFSAQVVIKNILEWKASQ